MLYAHFSFSSPWKVKKVKQNLLIGSAYSVCLHDSRLWMKSIHHPLTNPTVKALINIHWPTMSWSLLLDPLYHMVQQVNTDSLLLHACKIMELESVIAILLL